MMTFFSTILFFVLASLPLSEDHDVHISKCEIQEVSTSSKIELQVSIFYDDLLTAVGLRMGEELPENYESSDALIESFINDHLIIEINGEEKKLSYVESVSYPPAVWTTLEIENVQPIEELKIKNTILLKQFDDQKNIVSLTWKGKKKTIAMDHTKHLITFN